LAPLLDTRQSRQTIHTQCRCGRLYRTKRAEAARAVVTLATTQSARPRSRRHVPSSSSHPYPLPSLPPFPHPPVATRSVDQWRLISELPSPRRQLYSLLCGGVHHYRPTFASPSVHLAVSTTLLTSSFGVAAPSPRWSTHWPSR